VAAVASAFGVEVVRLPELEALIRRIWSSRLTEAALRLADAPAGARVIHDNDRWLPMVAFANVYMLPGVPQIFQAKLDTLREELAGEPLQLRTMFVSAFESDVADEISRVADEQPTVKIGSYPRMGDPDHRLRITVEGEDPEALDRAVARLRELLPAGSVLRIER
jgi:molybdopterin-biosynthesis enzyme MoeA-like protein